MKRPLGLKVIAILSSSAGVLGIILGLVFLSMRDTDMAIEAILGSAVVVILSVGLWGMRNWARIACIIVTLTSLLTELIYVVFIPSLFHLSGWQIAVTVIAHVFNLWTVFYLLTPRVRRVFLAGGRPLER